MDALPGYYVREGCECGHEMTIMWRRWETLEDLKSMYVHYEKLAMEHIV